MEHQVIEEDKEKVCWPSFSPRCCFDNTVWPQEGITLVTCVHIYLGAVSAQGYLCPPVTVSVSFRFHSVCNTHSRSSTIWRET